VHGDPARLCVRNSPIGIFGLAIEVHQTVGLGFLETVYGERLTDALAQTGIWFKCEIMVPVTYEGETRPLGVGALSAAHEVQLLGRLANEFPRYPFAR
jgi:hypothetical protein